MLARGRATRYAKNIASLLAAVHIRYIAIWAKFDDTTSNQLIFE